MFRFGPKRFFSTALKFNQVNFIGANVHAGQPKKGVEKSPDLFRSRGFLNEIQATYGLKVNDLGNVPDEITKLRQQCEYLRETIRTNWQDDAFSLALGGDHSVAHGTISGVADGLKDQPKKLIWVDAHGDLNDIDTSFTGNRHGMPVNALLGFALKGDPFEQFKSLPKTDVVFIGLRDLDPEEINLIEREDIKIYDMETVRRMGIDQVMSEVREFVGDDQVMCSYDIDAMDSTLCPGTGTPVADGLNMDEANVILSELCKTNLRSFELVEINVDLEQDNSLKTMKLGEDLLRVLFQNLKANQPSA